MNRLYFWFGEDAELEDVDELTFYRRINKTREAIDAWVNLKDTDGYQTN